MSVRVRGTINIQRKAGRKGDFNIGDLSTEVGVFEVKDALIEQFEPGKYTGEFIIQWIEPDSFSWRGRVFVKNRATLTEILVDEEDVGAPPPSTPPEPDPIDSADHAQQTLRQNAAPSQASGTVVSNASIESQLAAANGTLVATHTPRSEGTRADPLEGAAAGSSNADDSLFGAEIHQQVLQGEAIKLDPTVDREVFRHQRDRLKALGFAFDAKRQTWAPRGGGKFASTEPVTNGLDIPF